MKKCSIFLAILAMIFIACGSRENPSEADIDMDFDDDVVMYNYDSAVNEKAHFSKKAKVSSIASISAIPSDFNTDSFDKINEGIFKETATAPLSTFSADVDTASYALLKRFIDEGTLPPSGAIRIEELINAFDYSYEAPKDAPIAISTALSAPFWDKSHQILRIGIKAKEIDWANRPASNLTFLIDTSGSMSGESRIELVKKSLKMLVDKLDKRDKIGIVTYSGEAGVALEPTNNKQKILKAIESLNAGGFTHGSAGIEKAYDLAKKHFIKGGVNRIILATDGDFNVGISSQDELLKLIESKAKSGIYLSVFGFGMGNYKDSMLVKLADNGNGNYGYINDELEARRLLVDRIAATLIAVAKDVKIQVEFNPSKVKAYRLIGYEKRKLENEDFNDDSKDAGEMGVGHSVTALYEIIPLKSEAQKALPKGAKGIIDPLKYSTNIANKGFDDEVASVKIRYKTPKNRESNDEKSELIEKVVKTTDFSKNADSDTRFAMAVAGFGMILQDSKFKGSADFKSVLAILNDKAFVDDINKQEFIGIVAKASKIQAKNNKKATK